MQRKDLNYLKYLKYKNKYLNLRNQKGGGIDDEVNQIMQEANNFIVKRQYQEALEYINKQDYDHKDRVFRKIKNEQKSDWIIMKGLIEEETNRRLGIDKIMQGANKFIVNEQYQKAVDYIINESETIGKKNRVFRKFIDNHSDVWKILLPFIPEEHKPATRETSWLRDKDVW